MSPFVRHMRRIPRAPAHVLQRTCDTSNIIKRAQLGQPLIEERDIRANVDVRILAGGDAEIRS